MWSDEPFLIGAYAFGPVLEEPGADVEWVRAAFVVNLPADDVPWGTVPPSCAGLSSMLELGKAPVNWFLRPTVWPVANHVIRRPLRIWSIENGVDEAALDALGRGEAEGLRMPAPTESELREQLVGELAASLAHLRRVESGYWEREWRADHKGLGTYPENHLWDAVHGYLDLLDAVRRLDT